MRDAALILFNDFETLDAFDPMEVLGRLTEHFKTEFYSMDGGTIVSSQKERVGTCHFSEFPSESYIPLIPRGISMGDLVKDRYDVEKIAGLSIKAVNVLTICTDSILFSKTGLLDGKRATSNKRFFSWAYIESPNIQWIKRARWVRDANIYSGSGVSAGIDMTLGFI